MTVKEECAEKGRMLLNLYNFAYDIYGKIAEAPLRKTPADQLKVPIKYAFDALEMYYRAEKLFDEKTYLDIKTRLQDIEGRLPTVIKPEERSGDIEEKLKSSRWEADRLTDKMQDVMFQTVVECELKSPESLGYHGGGRIDRLPH